MREKALPKIERVPEIKWSCRKCGLMRSNRKTHIHGKEMID